MPADLSFVMGLSWQCDLLMLKRRTNVYTTRTKVSPRSLLMSGILVFYGFTFFARTQWDAWTTPDEKAHYNGNQYLPRQISVTTTTITTGLYIFVYFQTRLCNTWPFARMHLQLIGKLVELDHHHQLRPQQNCIRFSVLCLSFSPSLLWVGALWL